MATEKCTRDVPLGAIQSGPVQFIKQLIVNSEKELFTLELPGQITRCEGTAAFAVKAAGRIVIDCQPPELAATITAKLTDELALSQAITSLAEKIDIVKADGYTLRLSSKRNSFADVIEKAEGALGSCGNSGASLPAEISIGFANKVGDSMVWSEPVSAVIEAKLSNSSEFNTINDKLEATVLGPNATVCLSIWHGLWDRWTECLGPCSSGTCSCRTTDAGTPVVGCKGWVTCSCV